MNSKAGRWVLVIAGQCWLLGGVPSVAHADSGCESPSERRHYESGSAQGVEVVYSAWEVLANSCARVEELTEIVRETLDLTTPPDGASEQVECRYRGFIDGANQALDDIAEECCTLR